MSEENGPPTVSEQPQEPDHIDLTQPLEVQLVAWTHKLNALREAVNQHVYLGGIIASEIIHKAEDKVPGKTHAEHLMLATMAGGLGMHIGDAALCLDAAYDLIIKLQGACATEKPIVKDDPATPPQTISDQLKELGIEF